MSLEILAANLTALAAAGGPAAGVSSATSDRVRVTSAGTVPVAELSDGTGSWYRLHSARDPAREAAGLLDRALAGKPLPSLVAVLGAGLGWILDELERRAPGIRVIVFDPSPSLTRLWLERRSWERWFESGRLAVVMGPDYLDLTRWWAMVDAGGAPPLIVANPVMIRVLTDDLRQSRKAFDRLVFGAISNASARQQFGLGYLTNTLENLPRVLSEGDVADLHDLATGRTAVVIGAGPSLDANVAALRRADGRAVLIAADTALRPLLTQGVKPDFVVCLDPSDLNATHLQNLPDCRDVWLVAEVSVAAAGLSPFEGRTFFFRVSNNDPWPWLTQTGLTVGQLSAWGSVVTAALRLALLMGCARVVFVGLDLAYTNGQPYCRHTTFESMWARRIAQGATLANQWSMCQASGLPQVPDIGGGEVATTTTLIEFRDWLVEQTGALPSIDFVNATGRGILVGGRIVLGVLDEEFDNRSASAALNVASRWSGRLDGRRISPDELRRGLVEQVDGALPPAWREYGGKDGEPRVREALSRAVRELEPGTSSTCQYTRVDRSGKRLLWLPAANVAETLRSLLTWTGVLFDSAQRPAAESGVTAARFFEMARGELQQLLLLSSELTLGAPDETIGDPLRVPAQFAYRWNPEVLGRIQTFEELLAMACLLAPAALREWLTSLPGLLVWVREPVEPVLDVADDESPELPPPSEATERGPHLALCEEFAMGIAYMLSSDAEMSARARYWAAFAASLQGTDLVPDHELLASAGAWSGDSDPPSQEQPGSRTARIRTGKVETETLAAVTRRLRDVPPRVLTAEGLPRSYRACALSSDAALVTAWGHSCSYRVGKHGEWVQMPAWRHVIHGEIPSGPDGGGLAYDAMKRRVMSRPSADSEATIEDVEFTPLAVAEGTDGRVWWCAKEGGVWQGRPGDSIRLVAASPPLSSIELLDSSLMLIPGHYRKSGSQMRRRDDRRWLLDTSSLSIEQQMTGPLGQSLMQSVGGGWEAHAHSFSDVVHLRRQSTGQTALLHVYYPLAVVWAGASLVVVCNDGHVLLFESLKGRLDEAS